MPKYTLRFTRTVTNTYEKTVSAKDYDAALDKAEAISGNSDVLDALLDKDTEPETEYGGIEIEEAR